MSDGGPIGEIEALGRGNEDWARWLKLRLLPDLRVHVSREEILLWLGLLRALKAVGFGPYEIEDLIFTARAALGRWSAESSWAGGGVLDPALSIKSTLSGLLDTLEFQCEAAWTRKAQLNALEWARQAAPVPTLGLCDSSKHANKTFREADRKALLREFERIQEANQRALDDEKRILSEVRAFGQVVGETARALREFGVRAANLDRESRRLLSTNVAKRSRGRPSGGPLRCVLDVWRKRVGKRASNSVAASFASLTLGTMVNEESVAALLRTKIPKK